MDKKTRPMYMLSRRDSPKARYYRLKVKKWKKIFHANGRKRKEEKESTNTKIVSHTMCFVYA